MKSKERSRSNFKTKLKYSSLEISNLCACRLRKSKVKVTWKVKKIGKSSIFVIIHICIYKCFIKLSQSPPPKGGGGGDKATDIERKAKEEKNAQLCKGICVCSLIKFLEQYA